jgi:hypothetical protein
MGPMEKLVNETTYGKSELRLLNLLKAMAQQSDKNADAIACCKQFDNIQAAIEDLQRQINTLSLLAGKAVYVNPNDKPLSDQPTTLQTFKIASNAQTSEWGIRKIGPGTRREYYTGHSGDYWVTGDQHTQWWRTTDHEQAFLEMQRLASNIGLPQPQMQPTGVIKLAHRVREYRELWSIAKRDDHGFSYWCGTLPLTWRVLNTTHDKIWETADKEQAELAAKFLAKTMKYEYEA